MRNLPPFLCMDFCKYLIADHFDCASIASKERRCRMTTQEQLKSAQSLMALFEDIPPDFFCQCVFLITENIKSNKEGQAGYLENVFDCKLTALDGEAEGWDIPYLGKTEGPFSRRTIFCVPNEPYAISVITPYFSHFDVQFLQGYRIPRPFGDNSVPTGAALPVGRIAAPPGTLFSPSPGRFGESPAGAAGSPLFIRGNILFRRFSPRHLRS